MSILVKDMKMPERCLDCPMYDHYNYYCQMYAFNILARYNRDGSTRPEWCELVELPEKHGRLIDGDALVTEMTNGIRAGNLEDGYEKYQNINNMDDCVECVKYADVVIEAEGEG